VPFTESERFARAHRRSKVILYPGSQHAFVVPGYTATPAEIDRALTDSFGWLREIGLLPLQP
jgi:hypothetical protein